MVWKRWTDNVGVKTLSFVAALTLWFSVTNQIEFEKTIRFPIEYVNIPEGITPVRPLPAEVEARVRAQGRFLGYRLRGGVCRVDLSRHQSGISNVAIDGANLILPAKVPVALKEVVEPRRIAVEFDELVTREVGIHARITGTPADRFVRVGKIFLSPTVAKVSGPRKFVDEIGLVPTEPIDIERDRHTVRKRVRLQPPGPATVTVEPAMVEVGITIEPIVEKEIPGVVLELADSLPDSLRSEFSPTALRVRVSGARSIVDVAFRDIEQISLRPHSPRRWSPGTTELKVRSVSGPQVVFEPALALPGAGTGTNGDPPAGSGAQEMVARLPLPGGLEVVGVLPERIALTIAPAP